MRRALPRGNRERVGPQSIPPATAILRRHVTGLFVQPGEQIRRLASRAVSRRSGRRGGRPIPVMAGAGISAPDTRARDTRTRRISSRDGSRPHRRNGPGTELPLAGPRRAGLQSRQPTQFPNEQNQHAQRQQHEGASHRSRRRGCRRREGRRTRRPYRAANPHAYPRRPNPFRPRRRVVCEKTRPRPEDSFTGRPAPP